jgi:dihydropyrimidinase
MGTVTVDHFFEGSRAALAGGTTTVIDFVIPSPGESLIKAYDTWQSWAQESVCDYGFHVAITWWSDQVREEMGILARERGVNSFKHFMAYKGSIMLNDESLVNSFTRCKELGALPTVHAENGELVLLGQKRLLSQGITGPEGHPWSRPVEIESEATNRASIIANYLNTPVYIVHVSCRQSMEVIQRARLNGQRVYGEALAGHLTLDDSVYFKGSWADAARYVMSPPFRPEGNPDALWQGLQAGVLQTTATDHCTFCIDQKSMGKNDFSKIPNGCNGVEDRMSILWHHGVSSGKLTENEYVSVTSTNAAKIFNLYPRKGVIAVGSDADIVVIDPGVKRTISAREQWQAVDTNIWDGWEVQGVTVLTIFGGKVVWEAHVEDKKAIWKSGKFSIEKGQGKYLSRACFGSSFSGIEIRENINAKKPVVRV